MSIQVLLSQKWPPSKMHGGIADFEEAFRVEQVGENTYVGAHPLRLPIQGARGVYGGHTCAQTLLVAMKLAPGYVPSLFHSYFIYAGDSKVPMEYTVTKISDTPDSCHRQILVRQKGRMRFSCVVLLVRKGLRGQKERSASWQVPEPPLKAKYPNPETLHQVRHTDFMRHAYLDEFLDYRLCPEENDVLASERWITVWGGIVNEDNRSMRDPMFNYVGLADLLDLAILTTMARVLHLSWNPTEGNRHMEPDANRDARILLQESMNIIHIFHYDAMLLDHHIYFHSDDFEAFDISKEWLTLTYQMKRLSNNRTLVRGFYTDEKGECVATVVQEGLTPLYAGVSDNARL